MHVAAITLRAMSRPYEAVPIMAISPPCAGQPFRKDDIEDPDGGVSTL